MARSANIQSVERAFAVIRAIGRNGQAVPLALIASETGLPKSTVSRLLGTMVGIGAVERVADGLYSMGSELRAIVLPAVGPTDLIGVAAPYLRELVDELGEDVGLAIPAGDSLIYIDQVQSPQPVTVQDWTGERFDLHTTAAGYVLLAARSVADLGRYLAAPLAQSSPSTEVDPKRLAKLVTQCAKHGYAWTFEAWAPGINGVAAPVRDSNGNVVAAINPFGPAYRFPGSADRAAIGKRVASAANQVSQHLGG